MRTALLLPILMPLLLGSCGEESKPTDTVSVNPNLKYWTKVDEVTITNCDEKTSGALIIPATIEGKPVTVIDDAAFYERSGLTSITIPDSVTSIGGLAFSGCTGLTSISIGNGVASIGMSAFSSCSSLASITIPDGVTSLGAAAFASCRSLTAVTFLGDAPRSMHQIGATGRGVFTHSSPTIYRKPEAKGWGETFGGRPVKLISEKP